MEATYVVPEMSCSHCEAAVGEAVSAVHGVDSVTVDLESKHVVVRGTELDDTAIRVAIADAGYDVA
jgi:copper chaperone CopZ